MTNEELQSIINAVLSAIRTNSALITDLTEVSTLPSDAYIELSDGRRVKTTTLKSILQQAIMDDAVSALVASEKSQREAADVALRALITTIDAVCKKLDETKFNKADIVQEKGKSTTQVMSQKAVSDEINTLQDHLKNISLAKGVTSASLFSLSFTDQSGKTQLVPIAPASELFAGTMSATDYSLLHSHENWRVTIDGERLKLVSASATTESVKLTIDRTKAESLQVDLPIAGTLNEDDEPLAGIMSGQQAKDLADATSKCFPLEFIDEGDNTGVFEVGTQVQAIIAFSIMKQGENVTEQCEITANGLSVEIDDEGIAHLTSHDWITYNQTFRVVIKLGDETIKKTYEYKFMNYVFGFSFDEATKKDPKESIGSGCGGYWLSDDFTLGPTHLRPGEGYLFAVPNYSTLIVRDESGAEITDCEFGYKDVEYLESVGKRVYAYIIVPASTKSWTFKITNN